MAADEFLNEAPILPPNLWDPATRIEPPEQTPQSAGTRKQIKLRNYAKEDEKDTEVVPEVTIATTQSYCNQAFYLEPDCKSEKLSPNGANNNPSDDNNSDNYYISQKIELDSDDEEELERRNMGLTRSGR